MNGISSISGQSCCGTCQPAGSCQQAASTSTLKSSLNAQQQGGQAIVKMMQASAPLPQGVGTKVNMYA